MPTASCIQITIAVCDSHVFLLTDEQNRLLNLALHIDLWVYPRLHKLTFLVQVKLLLGS